MSDSFFTNSGSSPPGRKVRGPMSGRARANMRLARARRKPKPPLVEEFWAKVGPPTKTGCRLWRGHRLPTEYGVLYWSGKRAYAHRMAWELTRGAIPDRLCVLHHCDTPACCEITHLFLGTNRDNTQDMLAKRRGKWQADVEVTEARRARLSVAIKAAWARRKAMEDDQ